VSETYATLELRANDGGTRVELRVKPRASRSAVLGVRAGVLEVAVTAPPVDGEANAAVVEVVASALGVAKRDVELVMGASSRTKVLRVDGLGPDEVRARLGAARR
jgi:uncharacterized protein (TIGR00251 family)